MEIRSRELGSYAGCLRGLRHRLNEHEESLTARWEQWLREQQEASLAQARQGEKIGREEAKLREQRAEVVRLMTEMRQMRQQPDSKVEALREENERLKRIAAEREAAADAARDEARRQVEVAEELRAQLSVLQSDARADGGALQRFVVELDTSRRILDE
jgi:hypothetical protein